jgi:quercetin dioxygenase-like cupin family protein
MCQILQEERITDVVVCPAFSALTRRRTDHHLSKGSHVTQNGKRWHREASYVSKKHTTERNKNMDIKRCGMQPSGKGPAEYFTGTVRIDPLFEAPDPARAAGASVTFEPGARTAWHTHPASPDPDRDGRLWPGPTLEWSDRGHSTGDVIWFPPGEKHWHGATLPTATTHVAIQERFDNKAVDWMEHVSDEHYHGSS